MGCLQYHSIFISHNISSMDYKRIYDDLMQSRLPMKEDRIKLRKTGEYFEAHHIIPVSMGGKGNRSSIIGLKHPNLVLLTGREHYIAHALLWLIHRNPPMAKAFFTMCNRSKKNNTKGTNIISSRLYEELRKEVQRYNLGKKMTPEAIEKIRRYRTGRTMSEESKEKLRQYRTGRKMPADAIERSRIANMDPEVIARKNATRLKNKMLNKTTAKLSIKELIAGVWVGVGE